MLDPMPLLSSAFVCAIAALGAKIMCDMSGPFEGYCKQVSSLAVPAACISCVFALLVAVMTGGMFSGGGMSGGGMGLR